MAFHLPLPLCVQVAARTPAAGTLAAEYTQVAAEGADSAAVGGAAVGGEAVVDDVGPADDAVEAAFACGDLQAQGTAAEVLEAAGKAHNELAGEPHTAPAGPGKHLVRHSTPAVAQELHEEEEEPVAPAGTPEHRSPADRSTCQQKPAAHTGCSPTSLARRRRRTQVYAEVGQIGFNSSSSSQFLILFVLARLRMSLDV